MSKNTFQLGPDGELIEPEEPRKRKAKYDSGVYISFRTLIGGVIAIIVLLGVGALAGVYITRMTMATPLPTVAVLAAQPTVTMPSEILIPTETPSPTALPTGTHIPTDTVQSIVAPTSTPLPTFTTTGVSQPTTIPTRTLIPAVPQGSYPTFLTDTPQLIITVGNGAMYSWSAPNGLTTLTLRGHDVAASPAGKALSYVGTGDDSRIYVYRDGKQTPLNSFAYFHKPAWSPNGKSLSFINSGNDGHGRTGSWVFWLKMTSTFNSDTPLDVGFAKIIGAPPLTDPVSGDLLIVSNTSLKSSTFSLVDPLCGCGDQSVGDEFLSVPYNVNGATYDSTGSRIIFSEDSGNLYLIDTKTKQVSLFLKDGNIKSGPTLSPDDKLLAYFDDNRTLYILTMADKTIQTMTLPDIADGVAWAYSPTK